MRIVADTDVCAGSGQCVLTDPALFDQDDDGTVAVLVEQLDDAQAGNARQAVDLCPTRALRIAD